MSEVHLYPTSAFPIFKGALFLMSEVPLYEHEFLMSEVPLS